MSTFNNPLLGHAVKVRECYLTERPDTLVYAALRLLRSGRGVFWRGRLLVVGGTQRTVTELSHDDVAVEQTLLRLLERDVSVGHEQRRIGQRWRVCVHLRQSYISLIVVCRVSSI